MLSMPRPRALIVAIGILFITVTTFYSFSPRGFDYQNTFDIDVDIVTDTTQLASKTRGLHMLTTATGNDVNVCRLILSSAVLTYPPFVLLAWHGEGEFNAADDHLAKLRAPLRYFDTLPASHDDDLVLVVDGYDVVFQLGPDVLLKRYFETTKAADARLIEKFGEEHVKKHNMYTTTLFGPDVLCYPIDFHRPACWLVPESTLPRDAWGPETDKNDEHTRPRWLNSGTVLGPIKDVRRLYQSAMVKVNQTYDPEFSGRNSDQMYIADVWADQEFARTTSAGGQQPSFPDWDTVHDDVKDSLRTPTPENRAKAEHHIGIDYASYMFQTVALFYDIIKWETLSKPRPYKNYLNEQEYTLTLPKDVAASKPPYRALDTWTWRTAFLKRRTWADVPLAINLVTRNMFPVIHFTGLKHFRDMWWENLWFFQEAEMLLKAKPDWSVIAKIDGVDWVPYQPFGKPTRREDAWADTGEMLAWEGLCGEHEGTLFSKWNPPPPPPPPEEEHKGEEHKEEEHKEDEHKEEEKSEKKEEQKDEQEHQESQ